MPHGGDPKVLLIQILVVIGLPLVLWGPARLGHIFPLPILQIFAGLILGPTVLGSDILHDTWMGRTVFDALSSANAQASVKTLSSLALVLFVFLAGCEVDRGLVAKSGRMVLAIGASGVALPWILGSASALVILRVYPAAGVQGDAGASPALFAVAFGLCMAVTALPVLNVVLRELGFHRRPIGSVALAIGGVDDLLLWLSLAVILPLAQGARHGALTGFAIAIGGLVAAVLALRFVIAPLLSALVRREAEERFLMSASILALFFSALITESCGLHAVLGAFLTGLFLPERLRHMAQDRFDVPVNLLLLPFLFLSTGLETRFSIGDPTMLAILGIAFSASVCGKLVGIAAPTYLSGQTGAFAVTLAVLMQCKGLMEIVIVTILYRQGIFGEATFSALVVAALLSTALTAPLARLCLRVFGDRATELARPVAPAAVAAPAYSPAFGAGQPYLVFEDGLGTFPVLKPESSIGRHSHDDIRAGDLRVSRRHAMLRSLGEGRYEIDNLTAVRSEPNPMLVNGMAREHAALADGDVVTLGGVSFTFHQGRSAARAA